MFQSNNTLTRMMKSTLDPSASSIDSSMKYLAYTISQAEVQLSTKVRAKGREREIPLERFQAEFICILLLLFSSDR